VVSENNYLQAANSMATKQAAAMLEKVLVLLREDAAGREELELEFWPLHPPKTAVCRSASIRFHLSFLGKIKQQAKKPMREVR